MVILFLTFWETAVQRLYHITFSPTVHKGSSFSTSLQTFVIFCFFSFLFFFTSSYPNVYEVVPHYSFDLHFANVIVMLNIFSCAYWSLCIFFGEMSMRGLYLFLNQVFFLLLSFRSSLYILDIIPLIRYMFCTYFLPFCGLPFYSLDSVF